jgi:cephalosporin hydroxylase
MLALLDLCDAMESSQAVDPGSSKRKVLGVDVDIRPHNRLAIEAHPMSSRIQMIQGSSIDSKTVAQVRSIAANYSRVMVCLDSNHTHDHVLAELNAYASLASIGSYCVVFDTVVQDLPKEMFLDRPWGPDNNPRTAVHEFLQTNKNFVIDEEIHNKLLITVAQDGYLKRI